MAIKSATELAKRKQIIDLTGPQGNAFFLMGTADKLAKQLGKDGKEIMKHETRSTTAVLKYCSTCGRATMHRCSDRRVGTCLEHSAKCAGEDGRSARQIKEAKRREKEELEPRLF